MTNSQSSPNGPNAGRSTFAGLFLVTLATLAYQILLTRIFSVTIWYHFAFLTVSIAMLGMTIGAIAVYVFPVTFSKERVHAQLARCAFVFALTIVLSLVVHLSFPVRMEATATSIASIVFTCILIAIPFTASGICVALALTRFPLQVSRLYAVDLAGAAVGCLSLVFLLSITDGPTAVFAVALLANIAVLCFASRADPGSLFRWAALSAAALAVFVVGHTVLVHQQQAFVRVGWGMNPEGQLVKVPRPLYERWNTHSRVRVFGDPDKLSPAFGWSMSPKLPKGTMAKHLSVDIDTGALTVMTDFGGSIENLDYLRYDMVNLANALRSNADVLIVGAGAGRDILSALFFKQNSVVAVEINSNVLHVVHDVFGDFSGHLDQHPKVTLINDEARSFVARSPDFFDIIQISLIDSWAATAAGAFVLTENALYTVEAWEIFLRHLKPGGILTLTRYYYAPMPSTAYRLVSVAVAALEGIGVETPRDHIALVRAPSHARAPLTNVTILVSPDPFSAEDLERLGAITEEMAFIPLLTPGFSANEIFETVSSGGDRSEFFAEFPYNIEPSTDDKPFFFHMLRFSDIFNSETWNDQGFVNFNIRAVLVLGVLLATVSILTLVFVFVPLFVRSRITSGRKIIPWFLHFSGIGAGFMMIEISQVERLIVFLGHPVYSLTVVLFTLLLASGAGSYSTERVGAQGFARAALSRMGLLLGALALFGFVTPVLVEALQDASTPVRILSSVAVLAPIGFMMGMPFPLGIKAASLVPGAEELTPWMWGMNGATSVLASVLAIVIAMSAGITVSFWTGFFCYLVATSGLYWVTRSQMAPAR